MMQQTLPRVRKARHFLRRRLRGALEQSRDILDRQIERLESREQRFRDYAAAQRADETTIPTARDDK